MTASADALVGTPLSPDQLRLWRAMADCQAQSFRSYGIAKVSGGISLARLRDAFERVAREDDLLRSRLVSVPGMVYPVLMADIAASVVYHDMGRLDGDEHRTVERMAEQLASCRFALEQSSLVHVSVGRIDDDDVLWGMAVPAFLADGPSVDVLLRKVSRLAVDPSVASAASAVSDGAADVAERQHEPARLPYRSICRWRERLLESEEAAAGRRLWLEKVTSCDHARFDTILPVARGTTSTASTTIGRLATTIPADAVARLAAAASERTAAASSFFAAWYFLLWKLCNGPAADFYVASQFDGRSVADLAGAIGPLARFLPIAATIDREQRWRTLRDVVAKQLGEADEWQDCFAWADFDDLEDSSTPLRSFDYGFELIPEVIEPGGALTVLRRYSRSERFTLKLDVRHSQGHGCELALYHDPQRVSHDHAAALLDAYRYVLAQVAADDTVRLKDLKWPGVAESGSGAAASRLPVAVPVPAAEAEAEAQEVRERFSRMAAQYPDRIALASDEGSLSYARLHVRAYALTRTIRERAPSPESCIAIVGGISFNTIIGLVAILKSGHYFVHIDPEHPPARTVKVLRECRARVILHDGVLSNADIPELIDSLRLDGVDIIAVDATSSPPPASAGTLGSDGVAKPVESAESIFPAGPVAPAEPAETAASAEPAERLAYVTYTSGSTGEPNGVMISQASLARQIAWLIDSFGLGRDDACLLKTPLGFDASIWEWMTPLCVGARLVIGGKNLHRDPARIVESVRDHRVSLLQVVPSLLRFLIDEASPGELQSLRYAFAGGEALPLDVCQAVGQRWPATLVNLYGPTETTINASSWEVPRELAASADVAIGRPVDGMSATILDTLGQPLPQGFIGELYLAGSGLARGYAQKPRHTAEKFVPAWLGHGQRMYRTGDLASSAGDGTLFYWGRCDSQVKLRGYRIELAEIEAVLSSHGTVKTAAACIRAATGSADTAQLIAYVVPKHPSSRLDTQALRAYLRERLPEYMVPASIAALDRLPLTLTGKLDRKMLASPDFAGRPRSRPYVAPETKTQAALCEIWRRILDVETVGIGDDFLALGGRSLLVTRLIGHVKDTLGVEITPRLVFDFPVLREFAAQIDRLDVGTTDGHVMP